MEFDDIARLKQGDMVVINGVLMHIVKMYKGIKVNIVKEFTLKDESGNDYLLQLVFNDKTMSMAKFEKGMKTGVEIMSVEPA